MFMLSATEGAPEGTAIEGYVVEDHIDSVLGSLTTQSDAIEWQRSEGIVLWWRVSGI